MIRRKVHYPKMCFARIPLLLINLYNSNNEAEQAKTTEKVKLGIGQLDPDHDCNTIFEGNVSFIQDQVYDADAH